jgi:hypothetical protein
MFLRDAFALRAARFDVSAVSQTRQLASSKAAGFSFEIRHNCRGRFECGLSSSIIFSPKAPLNGTLYTRYILVKVCFWSAVFRNSTFMLRRNSARNINVALHF